MRGSFEATTGYRNCLTNILFIAAEIAGLNLLGRDVIKASVITIDEFFSSKALAISLADINLDLQSAFKTVR